MTTGRKNTSTPRTGRENSRGDPIRFAGVAGCVAAAVMMFAASSQNSLAADFRLAEVVIVKKTERRIYLVADGQVLRSFKISLGLMPDGDKMQEGDFRTPEGRYELTERNPDSDFFMSVQISYPNRLDEERAASLGVSPGGQIMIHGRPNEPRYSETYYGNYDWTNGCIALSNLDMMDFWRMTSPNTPIYIVP